MPAAAFTHSDIQRAVKAAKQAGLPIAGIDFPRAGGFRLLIGEPVRLESAETAGRNEWDSVLTQ
ncbi:hypothetical protein [Brevundimonas sp. DC300-4]|uniref:hypothetical protein n=1 Tax=Brevundimonas sp. DC300-4 TaxID=2804594 RepID=UPI003CF0FEE5